MFTDFTLSSVAEKAKAVLSTFSADNGLQSLQYVVSETQMSQLSKDQ